MNEVKSYSAGDLYGVVSRRFDRLGVGNPRTASLRRLALPSGDGRTVTLSNPSDAGAVATGDGLLAVDTKTMSAGFVVSSARRDRHGDVVVPGGCKEWFEDYERNPVVFFAHKSDCLPIASARTPGGKSAVWFGEESITSRAYFHGKTRESEEVFSLVADGHLRAASIGFIPVEGKLIPPASDEPVDEEGNVDFDLGGLVFTRWQLLEWSVVPVPANAEALRSRLQSSKSLSPVLRKSLEPFAAPARGDRARFVMPRNFGLAAPGKWLETSSTALPVLRGANPKKQMTEKELADDLTKPPVQPGAPKEGDDSKEPDCQAFVFHPDRFHDEASVKQWLEDNGYGEAEVTPGEEGDEPWVAVVFPADQCEAGTGERQEIEDGVEMVTCKKATAGEENKPDDAGPKPGDEMGTGKALGEEAPKVDAGEKPGEGEEEGAGKPYGCQVLCEVKVHLEAAAKYVGEAVAQLEQEKVKKWLGKYAETLAKFSEDLDEFGAGVYPDHFGKKTKKKKEKPHPEPDGDEGGGAGDDDEDDKGKKSFSPSRRPVVGKGAVARKDVGVMTEAAEFLKELAGDDNLKRSQKAGCRLHAGDLDSLCQKYTETSDEGSDAQTKDAGGEDEARLLEAVSRLAERYYELTGEEI